MPVVAPETNLPEEASLHLEQIVDEQHRAAIADRLGSLSVLNMDQVGQPLEHYGSYDSVEEEPLPYGQTEKTTEIVTGIAQRAKTVSAEARSLYPAEEISPERVWDKILESELIDLRLAKESGNEEKIENLLIEHMVTLELAGNGGQYYSYEHQNKGSERARLSMLRIAELGLPKSAIVASRRAYGLVVATATEPSFLDRRSKDGNPVVLSHELHSVAHAFEGSFKPLEVGMGSKISLDPDDAPFTEVSTDLDSVKECDALDSAIAVAARAAQSKETGSTPEDTRLVEMLNHQALRSLGEDRPLSDVRALESLLLTSPDLATSASYDGDFAHLRQRRLVDSNYRVNDLATSRLDQDIVLLTAAGKLDLAKRLITTNESEVVNPNYPDRDGVLVAAVGYGLDGYLSEAEQQQVAIQLKAMQAEKAANLKAHMGEVIGNLTISERSKEALNQGVLVAHDPESALFSLQAIQKAAGEGVDEVIMEKVVHQLLEQTGWNDSIVLDEIGSAADSIAPLFSREDFRDLANHYFGSTARSQIMKHPERAEQILKLFAHPTLQSILKGSSMSSVINDAVMDPAKAEKTLARLDEMSQLIGLLDDQQIISVLREESAANFVNQLTVGGEKAPFFDKLGPEVRKVVIDIGLQTPVELQGRVITNASLLEQVKPTLDLLKKADLLAGADLLINRSLLLAEDLPRMSQELNRAFTETQLLKLIGREGPAYTFGSTILNLVVSADNPHAVAQQACEQLLSNDPLWLRCYKISQIGIGDIEEVGFQTGLNIKEIPLSLPVPSLSSEKQLEVLKVEAPKPFAELSLEEKRLVADLSELSDAQVDAMQEVAFSQLAPEYQRALLAFRLFETIALSRDPSEQQMASDRNRGKSYSERWLEPGDLVHATNTSISLRAILTSGALAGEALGFRGRADSYPFNLDTVVVSPDVTNQLDYPSQLGALKNQGFGEIAIVFGRGPGASHVGEEFQGGMNEDHRLILGGLPSTQISALLLRGKVNPETIAAVKRVVAESGMYIPVVSPDGTLLITAEEFSALQQDENMQAIHPEVVDNAFHRANSQSGSNEGAEFIVPRGASREPEHWYVKFGDDNPDRLWTEILADSFYRAVVPEVVPETRPIIVEGRLARASRMVAVDEEAVTDEARNEAFVMDCLLGNWDAVFNANNIVMSAGHGLRIDTGNSFDFRARGTKKPQELFSENVGEITEGSDDSNLGTGMRQMYPGLTEGQIRQQVTKMQEELSDQVIDELVDGIRRPSSDRESLKRIVKARRDYIINYFTKEPAGL